MMKEEEIKELFEQFEAIANESEGVECWSARELAQVLGLSLIHICSDGRLS